MISRSHSFFTQSPNVSFLNANNTHHDFASPQMSAFWMQTTHHNFASPQMSASWMQTTYHNFASPQMSAFWMQTTHHNFASPQMSAFWMQTTYTVTLQVPKCQLSESKQHAPWLCKSPNVSFLNASVSECLLSDCQEHAPWFSKSPYYSASWMQTTYTMDSSPWYNRNGWVGVKHHITYLHHGFTRTQMSAF